MVASWLRHIKLNFLNFVALPITFGIGVDYAVNVMQHARLEGRAHAAHHRGDKAVVLAQRRRSSTTHR
jgi:predicted RND superfamily exporter protein